MKNTTRLTIKFYWGHIKKYGGLLTIMVLGMIVAVGVDITIPFFFKNFFDLLSSGADVNVVANDLFKIIFYILGLNAFGWIFWRIIEFMADYFWSRVMSNIRMEIFDYLHQHSYTFFNNNFVGALVKKAGKLVSAFEGLMAKAYWDILALIIRVSVTMVILFYVNVVIGAVMLVWTIFFIVSNYLFAIFKLKYDVARSEADTKITASFADTVTNNINIKLFTNYNHERKGFMGLNDEWRRKARLAWNLSSALDGIQAFLMIGLEFFLFYYGVKFWQAGQITLGDFILIQSYLLQILHRLWDFARVIRDVYQQLSDAEEMIEILNTPHEINDVGGAKALKVTEGHIEFKNVVFAYHKDKNVINKLNLDLSPGEKVALIGPSGGGKSTIVKLLFRFFDINDGKILIDGQDISKVKQNSLRAALSLVPQDPVLFHRTLMENIRYGRPDATDLEVIAAAKKAHCHEFISQFPDQYNTYVGERGIKLSGGERQRVAIARAILKNAPILVLDEATSSLDSESEMFIQKALKSLMKGKTTIVIAHRLSTIMQMDRILVIKEGSIVESGTHKELTQKRKGLYKMLWELQAGGFLE